MASVKSSRTKVYGTKSSTADDEAPEHVQSDGEILIKEMVKKQLGTQLTLNQQLSQKKEFQTAVGFEPLTNLVSGQSTLGEFQATTSKAALKEDLQYFGLETEEIELLLDWDQGEEYFDNKYKNIEKSILQSRLKEVHIKMHDGKSRQFQLQEEGLSEKLSRHELELEAVKPESVHSRLYQFALSCQPAAKDARPLSHPINQLKRLEQELFGHLTKKPKRSKKKKRKTIVHEDISEPSTSSNCPIKKADATNSETTKRTSLWDVTTAVPPKTLPSSKVFSCKPEVLYTIKNNKIVPLENVKSITTKTNELKEAIDMCGKPFVVLNDEQLLKNQQISINQRLTLEDIRKIPRFQNYEPGIPSKVLFIKNLHNNTREDDLVGLYSTFESPGRARIMYRLMCGKMKGQAFITFPDTAGALLAFDATNGCLLKGKPVIIQFGKQTAATSTSNAIIHDPI